MNDLQLELQTLTPLWTGGVETGRMDRIHEAGIIGSLRWWYEAIVRGLGGDVCDPTSEGPNADRCPRPDKTYCDVCRLFGATGRSRRFRLTMSGGEHLFPPTEEDYRGQEKPSRIQITAPGGRQGWYFGAPLVATEEKPIIGRICELRSDSVANDLLVTLAVASRWGALGAKPQHGWGVVESFLKDEQGNLIMPDVTKLVSRFSNTLVADDGLPSLSNFFFAKLYFYDHARITDTWWDNNHVRLGTGATDPRWRIDEGFPVPIAPAVKYKLRYGRPIITRDGRQRYVSVLKSIRNHEQSQYLFGRVNPNRAAVLNISNAYKRDGRWQSRLWGWFPKQGNVYGIKREDLLIELHHLVTANTTFWDSIFGPNVVDLSRTVWRELDHIHHGRNQPTCPVPPTTVGDLLHCLLV